MTISTQKRKKQILGGGGKLPGKTKYAGRRREMTRKSGFKVNPNTTGGEFKRAEQKSFKLKRDETVEVSFYISGHATGDLLGYGMWFWHSTGITCSVIGGPEKRTLTTYGVNSWNKLGSIWQAPDSSPVKIVCTYKANHPAEVALADPVCGRIRHKHLDNARPELLSNMYQFAPEAIFDDKTIKARFTINTPEGSTKGKRKLVLKSCNRCGRYLPINVSKERDQLSFSNHCVADHRRPCKHATFGRLRNVDDTDDVLQLDYGFQLECRFCKKFEVNAAHNPQRSPAQMKEDGARRRALEDLLAELYKGTPQLGYRHQHGTELTDDVWKRFKGKCFKCGKDLPTARDMNLDHTRPLALLWPLDGTATALCGPCNSAKRDRPPGDFYTGEEIERLSQVTGIGKAELQSTAPNEEALDLLLKRLDWFFNEFLMRSEMTREKDGKITGELVVKALQKVFEGSPRHRSVDLCKEYNRRRSRR